MCRASCEVVEDRYIAIAIQTGISYGNRTTRKCAELAARLWKIVDGGIAIAILTGISDGTRTKQKRAC